jgi:hypothetical protein
VSSSAKIKLLPEGSLQYTFLGEGLTSTLLTTLNCSQS